MNEFIAADARGVVVVGAYGDHNAGDELILAAVIEHIRNAGGLISAVLSDLPAATTQRHGVRSVRGFSRRGLTPEAKDAIRQSGQVFIGGGELFQPGRWGGWFSGLAWRMSLAAQFARENRIPVHIARAGIAANQTPASIRQVQQALRHADSITLRDDFSVGQAREWGFSPSFERDFVFGAWPGVYKQDDYVVFAPAGSGATSKDAQVAYYDRLGTEADVRWLVMDARFDAPPASVPSERVINGLGLASSDLVRLIRESQAIVSARMHVHIVGDGYVANRIAIERDDKMRRFALQWHLPLVNNPEAAARNIRPSHAD